MSRSSIVWIALSAICGAIAAALLLLQLAESTGPREALPEITLLDRPLKLDQQAPKRALNRLRNHVSGLFTLNLPGGKTEQVAFGDLGVEIDKVRLGHLLRDSIDHTSPISRWRRRESDFGPIALPAPLRIQPERAWSLLRRIKDQFDQTAIDARLNLVERQIMPSRVGLLLDIDQSLHRLKQAVRSGKTESELWFEEVRPQRRTEQLTNIRFDHVIAAFETHYDRADRAAARTYNLRLAASRLDGYVLLPGEVFDFNRVVGPRDEANGYKVAPVIAQGELVDGIGGGTCQISGTLHGAAFFAGLEIVERYPHTRPSSYIKLGLDATVVYPTINYRLRNPFEFPIVLHQTVKDGVVRAEVLGPKRDSTVTLIRRIQDAQPFDEIERNDPKLPRGERILGQRGVAGFKVKLYRITRHGDHAVRERWSSVYPPTTQIVRVGTGAATREHRADHDRHPEYTADELLVMTLQRDSEGSPDFAEWRQPGRFGRPGWTAQAGMPTFEVD